jgi:hypothetical protein
MPGHSEVVEYFRFPTRQQELIVNYGLSSGVLEFRM